jgi:hypothetical protein
MTRIAVPPRKRSKEETDRLIAEKINAEQEAAIKVKRIPLRSGDGNAVEEETEKYLAAARRKNPKESTDYLSRDQLILRQKKEVYNVNGMPDAHLMSGMYKKVYNPQFGNRPGNAAKNSDD